MDNRNDKKNQEKKDKKTIKIITMIIIIIIIILLLITSCSCASKLIGKIGNIFDNEDTIDIDDKTDDKQIITNRELKFDTENLEIFESDENIKITYHYENINPEKLTCFTSNAEIATCYVKDDYVVIIPKKSGEIEVILEADTNGIKYRALVNIKVKNANRYIKLTETKGTINLNTTKEKNIAYSLVGLKGIPKITISNTDIATAQIKNGILKIIGKKIGNVKITLTLNYNNKEYKETYDLKIIEEKQTKQQNNKENRKNSDSSLKKLTTSLGDLNFNFKKYKYYLSVPYEKNKLDLNAVPNNNKSKVKYKYKGKTYDSIKDIELQVGKNNIEIEVTAEDSSKTTYTLEVTRGEYIKSNDSTLKDLKVNKGTLKPTFKNNITEYRVSVQTDQKTITVYPKLNSSKAKVIYTYNGIVKDNLNDLPLDKNINIVTITVIAEDSSKTTYQITIVKEKSDNNNLSKLEVLDKNMNLDKKFDKNETNYNLKIPYDKDKVSFNYDVEDKKSSIEFKLNGKKIDDIKDIDKSKGLKDGDNTLEIEVKSESGETKTYTVNIHKSVRTIKMQDNYTLYINGLTQHSIIYQILEDGVELKENQYNKNDITINEEFLKNYKGTYKIESGYILLTPDREMDGKEQTLTLTYNNKSATTTIKYEAEEFYLYSYKNEYDLDISSDNSKRSIVLNNNLFTGDIRWEETENGIRIYDDNSYIELEFDKTKLKVNSVEGNTSLTLEIEAYEGGEVDIYVKGNAYGREISDFTIKIKAKDQYILTLKANEGYFDEFTTIYEFKLPKGEFDLSSYIKGYYIDEDCNYYELIGFKDSKGQIYDKTINIDKDITLDAIYSENKTEKPVYKEKKYLAEVDLFHNEEYYKLYNEDKVIYPNAEGNYTMFIDNNTSNNIIITGLTIEEKSLCTSDGCLNMGYKIYNYDTNKREYIYHFGQESNYKILNTSKTVNHLEEIEFKGNQITVKNGDVAGITLAWKWIDFNDFGINDKIDTEIGSKYGNDINNKYGITVAINYKIENTDCEVTP